jgi:hypothetical protein
VVFQFLGQLKKNYMIIDGLFNFFVRCLLWVIGLFPDVSSMNTDSVFTTVLSLVGNASIWTKHLLPYSFPALMSAFWIMLIVESAIQGFNATNWVINKLRGSG